MAKKNLADENRWYFFKVFLFFIIFFVLPNFSKAEVIWEQNWNNVADWQSIPNQNALGLEVTHQQALTWNASSYRYAINDDYIFKINNTENHTGTNGKSVAYNLIGYPSFMGGSIDITFADPDITWSTSNISANGYDELFYRVWMKTPTPVDFATGVQTKLLKAARFYAYDGSQYDWNFFLNEGEALSSHYFDTAQTYKDVFFIPSFASVYMYWYPQWHSYNDPDQGTIYPGAGWNNAESYLFDSYLDDGNWHCIEFHIKLNDVGNSNSVYSLYIDGNLEESTIASNLEMRDNLNTKIMSVMLFDNYSKSPASGTQTLYLDDMVISTEYIGPDYIIGSGVDVVAPTTPSGLNVL